MEAESTTASPSASSSSSVTVEQMLSDSAYSAMDSKWGAEEMERILAGKATAAVSAVADSSSAFDFEAAKEAAAQLSGRIDRIDELRAEGMRTVARRETMKQAYDDHVANKEYVYILEEQGKAEEAVYFQPESEAASVESGSTIASPPDVAEESVTVVERGMGALAGALVAGAVAGGYLDQSMADLYPPPSSMPSMPKSAPAIKLGFKGAAGGTGSMEGNAQAMLDEQQEKIAALRAAMITNFRAPKPPQS